MTDITLDGQKKTPRRKLLSYLSKLRAPAFWNFFFSRVFGARVLPIMAFLFITVNAWGLSYWHWLKRWGHFYWGRVPEFSTQTQLELGLFVLLGVTLFLGVMYLMFRRQYSSFASAVFWRLATTAALILTFYNPWLSYAEYAGDWWNKAFPGSTSYSALSYWQGVEVAAVGLFGVGFAIAWYYVGKKAWQGLGSSKITAALVALLITALGLFLSKLGAFPGTFRWQFTLIQIFVGIAIGICFSLTLIDRFLSGTVGATTTIKEIDADGGHHHDGNDQDVGHDAAVLEQDDNAAGHR